MSPDPLRDEIDALLAMMQTISRAWPGNASSHRQLAAQLAAVERALQARGWEDRIDAAAAFRWADPAGRLAQVLLHQDGRDARYLAAFLRDDVRDVATWEAMTECIERWREELCGPARHDVSPGGPGRRLKYPDAIALAVAMLQQTPRPRWRAIHRKCKKLHAEIPARYDSFMKTVKNWLKRPPEKRLE